ncbi:hypothetical protein OEG84_13570 [Hoeflea sp. G2-23]|uniref:Uncharacterized protein n=1 Tax=Hoeflea algicola TaxID=2983763 RepID=A0ABT3ZBJ8_9HYPH|nr:hypothetical protein [Hoeflea algicola]MCY0148699.1 hypothetical protein [Hoeflea algicola]
MASVWQKAEMGAAMGFSGRATQAIDPESSDLLMPDRAHKMRPARVRDVEDASFETLGRPRQVQTEPTATRDSKRTYKPRITDFPSYGPVPRDFAAPERAPDSLSTVRVGANDRLGVFAGGRASVAGSKVGRPKAGVVFTLTVGIIAVAALWMAGGHALLLEPAAPVQALTVTAPVAPPPLVSRATLLKHDPVITSSIAVLPSKPTETSIIHPKPRPARIERAGSILMIRPAGN